MTSPLRFTLLALAGLAALNLAVVAMEIFAPTIRFQLDPAMIQPDLGKAFHAQLGQIATFPYIIRSDDEEKPHASNLILTEDGKLVGPAHTLHATIRERGGGAYSFWRGTLYFSTAGGEDARSGVHTFVISGDASVGPRLLWLISFFNVASFLLVAFVSRKLPSLMAARAVRQGATLISAGTRDGGKWFFAVNPDHQFQSHDKALFFVLSLLAIAGIGTAAFFLRQQIYTVAESLLGILGFTSIDRAHFAFFASTLLLLLFLTSVVPQWARTVRPVLRIVWTFMSCSVVALFLLPLLNAWGQRSSSDVTIGGLLPFSDAAGYYHGVMHLLRFNELYYWNQRRPINTAFDAIWMGLVHGDLMAWIFLKAILVALACLLAAREVMRSFGLVAATVFVIPVYTFISPYLPTTLSENNGLFFGLLSFAALWRAAVERHLPTFVAGMASLSVGLAARAGAYFILPTLVVWGCLSLSETSRRSFNVLVWGCVGALAGLAISKYLLLLWGTGTGELFSNFAGVLYGLATGEGGWQRIYADHPEILQMPTEAQQTHAIYALALQHITSCPSAFAWAIWENLVQFINNLESFTFLENSVFGLTITYCLIVFRSRVLTMLLCAFAGVLLSSPFLIQDGGVRVFAATVPYLAAFPAVLTGTLVRIASRLQYVSTPSPDAGQTAFLVDGPRSHGGLNLPCMMSLVTVVILLSVAPLVVYMQPSPVLPKTACSKGQIGLPIVPGRSGEFVYVHDDASLERSFAPDIRYSDFVRDLSAARYAIPDAVWRMLSPPFTIGSVTVLDLDLDAGRGVEGMGILRLPLLGWMVVGNGILHLRRDGRVVTLCGEPVAKGVLQVFSFVD